MPRFGYITTAKYLNGSGNCSTGNQDKDDKDDNDDNDDMESGAAAKPVIGKETRVQNLSLGS